MNNFRNELIKIIDEYSEFIQKTEASLEGAPEGVLRLAQKKKWLEMYVTFPGKKEVFLRKDSVDLARKLAQKSYDQKVLALLKNRVAEFSKVLAKYSEEEVMDVYRNMHPARQNLVTPLILTDNDFIEQWYAKGDQEANPYEIDGDTYSERGEHVRSKTEKILADKFLLMGIPYKYESTLLLSGERPMYPDFTVLNVRTRKTYLWEHNGRMDDPGYCEREMIKRNKYIKHGIWPGDSLIVTEESNRYPLSNRVIEDTIKKYLL